MKKKNDNFLYFLVAVGNVEAQRRNQQMGLQSRSSKKGLNPSEVRSSAYLRVQRNRQLNGS